MNINWHDVATIVATMGVLGGIMIALLKGFFVTTKACGDHQDKCQAKICKKIDDLKLEIKEDRKVANNHYAEIKQTLGLIQGKLDG